MVSGIQLLPWHSRNVGEDNCGPVTRVIGERYVAMPLAIGHAQTAELWEMLACKSQLAQTQTS